MKFPLSTIAILISTAAIAGSSCVAAFGQPLPSSCARRGFHLKSQLAAVAADVATENLPELGLDGIYHVVSPNQHKALLAAYPDKLIVVKFFAPWCKACKGIEQKYLGLSKNEKFKDLPIIFADLSVSGNKEYIKSLGILALPTVHFYAGSKGLVESFPCGPSKFSTLKRKLTVFINESIDPKTLLLKEFDTPSEETEDQGINVGVDLTVGGENVSKQQLDHLRSIPYFKDLEEREFFDLMKKAKLLSFGEGSIIMREGKRGRTFYVIESGEVEITCKTAYEDPLSTPPSYLGTVINRLGQNDFFGERSLITGEPRAASIRALENTKCFAFDVDDMPPSTVLSGKTKPSVSRIEQVNSKYGVDVHNLDLLEVSKQLEASKIGSQIRGSVNKPKPIKGVDTDEEAEELPLVEADAVEVLPSPNDTVLNLLQRFRLIRYAARCFNYIIERRPQWGDPGSLKRRSMLVSKLPLTRRQEFMQVFELIDRSGDNEISLLELKQAMESVGEGKSDEDLQEIMSRGGGMLDGKASINQEDFMGIMAEAEFFNLFKDMFQTLDKHESGFVRAGDIDRVLCGMRDLISDDRKSIIDVEDKDMLIDYEQFSIMLLGSSL